MNAKAATLPSEIDMNVTEYADDKVETYANIVDRKLRDLNLRRGSKRFVDINVMTDSINQLVCGQCAKDRVCEAEDDLMKEFKEFVGKYKGSAGMVHYIDKFDRARKKREKRKNVTDEDQSQVRLIDDVLGISSDISLQCETCTTHRYPMTVPRKRGKGQQKNTDAEENLIAIFLPFIAGVGPTELETILSMQGLPNLKHYQKTILRWQPTVAENIIKISEREMRYTMSKEIKATIIADKGEEYYESWINKRIEDREKIGLVVSYDMGWQKRASGNSYSSKSGHAFVVGMQTRRIIDCVVFSTNCKRYEYKPRKKKISKKNEKKDEKLTENGDVEDDEEEDETCSWRSSIPVQKSSIADDGFDSEVGIDTASKENGPVTNTDRISTTTVTTPQRMSTNAPIIIVTPNTDVEKSRATPDTCNRFICQPVNAAKTAKVLSKPTYERAVHPLEYSQIVSPEQMATIFLEPSNKHDNCPCNCDGSPGSMESDGMLWLMKRLHTMISGCVYYEYIVSDDDTTMKNYLTHPDKRPRGEVNIGGHLPKEIPVPKWFADPTHRAKCVAGKFFKYNKTNKNMSKLDCLRLKKYYSYYIKCNRNKNIEDIMKNIMAPLDHLFDDHKHCDSSWCHKKAEEDGTMECEVVPSERKRKGYYRCKENDKELYNSLYELYKPYIIEERIEQCRHEFETQVNEGMNTCVAKYAPKGRHYSKSISLEARVKVASGIYNAGYHFFWTEVMKELDVSVETSVYEFLLTKDKNKLRKYNRDHDHTNMAKQKTKEHEQLRKELELRYKNIQKNMEYSPMVGCDTVIGDEGDKNKEKDQGNVAKDKKGRRAQIVCKHKLYGCTGGTNAKPSHKSERSRHCTFSGKSKDEIRVIRDAYFREHPDARKEYEMMYPDEARKCKGNKRGGEGMYKLLCMLF